MDNVSAIFPKRMILRFAKKKKRKIEKKYYEICPKKMLKLVWISCIIPFSTVTDREKARKCRFYAPSGFFCGVKIVVWDPYPEIFLNFLLRSLGR